MYHKEEVVSSACASEQDLNRQSCSICSFVQGFLSHSNVNEKPLPIYNVKKYFRDFMNSRTRLKELPDASDRHRFLAPECDFIL